MAYANRLQIESIWGIETNLIRDSFSKRPRCGHLITLNTRATQGPSITNVYIWFMSVMPAGFDDLGYVAGETLYVLAPLDQFQNHYQFIQDHGNELIMSWDSVTDPAFRENPRIIGFMLEWEPGASRKGKKVTFERFLKGLQKPKSK